MNPKGVVARYFELLRREAYSEAAGLLTPECLRRFREWEVPRHRPAPLSTVESHLERNPELPREVAEYWVSQQARHPQPTLSDFFAGVDSEEALDSLSDLELFARHLEATDHAARMRRRIDALRERHPEHDAELRAVRDRQMWAWSFDILGSVEVEGRAYVLFGSLPHDDPTLRVEPVPLVAVLRMTDEGWRIAADPSPYSGMGVLMGPIEVTGRDGERTWLDPNDPA